MKNNNDYSRQPVRSVLENAKNKKNKYHKKLESTCKIIDSKRVF